MLLLLSASVLMFLLLLLPPVCFSCVWPKLAPRAFLRDSYLNTSTRGRTSIVEHCKHNVQTSVLKPLLLPYAVAGAMLESAMLERKRGACWPPATEESYKRQLAALHFRHWTVFPDDSSEDEESSNEADAENPLRQLGHKESFRKRFFCCRYYDKCRVGYRRDRLEATFQRKIQTEFGPVHIYTADGRDKCCNCFIAFAVRAVPSALVLSLDFRYAPGQSLTTAATTISGREVGRLALDLQQEPATANLDSGTLHGLGERWAQEAGLLQSSQQEIELVVGLRLLRASPTTVLWSEEAERCPPRFRLRSKTNLRALRWQRHMEALRQPSAQGAMDVWPEDTA